jgi:hypothetical protein
LLILGVGGAFSGVYKTVIIYTKTKRKWCFGWKGA